MMGMDGEAYTYVSTSQVAELADVTRLEADKKALQARESELMLEVSRLSYALAVAELEVSVLKEEIVASRPAPEPPHNWLNRGVQRTGAGILVP